ncbi:GMC family oxidoreductase N-terminal domain-containing protein [Candidatus Bathyarchaeota archaeon]|nr:GMC family oxidoreductase N-terminal domain-containing protein [Candidatus Bathyarchaeota archaeon]
MAPSVQRGKHANSTFTPPEVGWKAFEEFGLETPRDCANGDKHGLCWIPTAQNSATVERSHAGVGHYANITADRPNLDLLVEHKVIRVVVDKDQDVPAVEFRPVAGGEVKTVRPKREVILSAGAIHTPQILQLSGIASAEYLESAGIELIEDLPGVGQNFQDHCGLPITFKCTVTLLFEFYPYCVHSSTGPLN